MRADVCVVRRAFWCPENSGLGRSPSLPRPALHSLNPPAPHPPTTRTALALSQRLIPNQGLKEVTQILSFWPYCAGFPPVFLLYPWKSVCLHTHGSWMTKRNRWARFTPGLHSQQKIKINTQTAFPIIVGCFQAVQICTALLKTMYRGAKPAETMQIS